jgi:uncharacterized protein (DUF2236 family)
MRPFSSIFERQVAAFLYEGIGDPSLFTAPAGEESLVPIGGVAARVYRNPLSVYIGGMASVILELAEPRVREGVWGHSIFPEQPLLRLRRTGLAAMVSVYAARSVALGMIAGITKRHDRVRGVTPEGVPFHALDPELLGWVHRTAVYGFTTAFDRYAGALGDAEKDAVAVETLEIGRAFGVTDQVAGWDGLRASVADPSLRLEGSPVLEEFLRLMRITPALPGPFRHFQPLFVAAAIDIVPGAIQRRLGIEGRGLDPASRTGVAMVTKLAGRIPLGNHPKSLARQRLGLSPAD